MNPLHTVDVEEMLIGLRLENSVRVPVNVVRCGIANSVIFDIYCTDQCTLQPHPGPCRGFIPSNFYNVTTRRCEKFTYGGCKGNDNRFPSAANFTSKCSGEVKCLSISMIN